MIDAGNATVTLGANAVDLQADVTGNGGLFLFPFNDGVSVGLAGAAGALNLTTAELAHLRCTGQVVFGMGSVGAGDLKVNNPDFDRAFTIATDDPTALTQALSPAVRGRLVKLAAMGFSP